MTTKYFENVYQFYEFVKDVYKLIKLVVVVGTGVNVTFLKDKMVCC